jgi:hypothetical protein
MLYSALPLSPPHLPQEGQAVLRLAPLLVRIHSGLEDHWCVRMAHHLLFMLPLTYTVHSEKSDISSHVFFVANWKIKRFYWG